MLATSVALNLEGAPIWMQEDVANDGVASATMGGMNLRHILSTCLAATPRVHPAGRRAGAGQAAAR
jgi:Mn-containing catalase